MSWLAVLLLICLHTGAKCQWPYRGHLLSTLPKFIPNSPTRDGSPVLTETEVMLLQELKRVGALPEELEDVMDEVEQGAARFRNIPVGQDREEAHVPVEAWRGQDRDQAQGSGEAWRVAARNRLKGIGQKAVNMLMEFDLMKSFTKMISKAGAKNNEKTIVRHPELQAEKGKTTETHQQEPVNDGIKITEFEFPMLSFFHNFQEAKPKASLLQSVFQEETVESGLDEQVLSMQRPKTTGQPTVSTTGPVKKPETVFSQAIYPITLRTVSLYDPTKGHIQPFSGIGSTGSSGQDSPSFPPWRGQAFTSFSTPQDYERRRSNGEASQAPLSTSPFTLFSTPLDYEGRRSDGEASPAPPSTSHFTSVSTPLDYEGSRSNGESTPSTPSTSHFTSFSTPIDYEGRRSDGESHPPTPSTSPLTSFPPNATEAYMKTEHNTANFTRINTNLQHYNITTLL